MLRRISWAKIAPNWLGQAISLAGVSLIGVGFSGM